jgi:predicted RNA binding protein YcfA (HicA-like mRNA interferase family)
MKLPSIKPRELIKVLKKLNCFEKRQTGSHLIFYCPKQRKIVVVPIHPRDLKRGLVNAIRKELDLTIEAFTKLLRDC